MLVLVFHNTCFYTINIMKVFETVDMFANPFFLFMYSYSKVFTTVCVYSPGSSRGLENTGRK